MEPSTLYVTVLFLRQPGDFWVAQGLEFDLAAQGSSVEHAKRAFERTFLGQLALDRRLGRKPLAHLQPAPQEFWRVWAELVKERPQLTTEAISDEAASELPPAFMVQAFPESNHAEW